MGTRNRKIRKLRSSRTHGWGISGQHRDGGMKGGRGKAGLFKHKWTYVIRHSLLRKGKRGFKPIGKVKQLSIINVKELDEISKELNIIGKAKEEEGKIKINLSELGYEKLLGEGNISRAFEVKVKNSSQSALKKIEKAGGTVISPNK